MSRLATSFVLGYHGCDKTTAHKAVVDGAKILASTNDHDWLGPGAYFWEADPLRAAEHAKEKRLRGEIEDPAVIGAVIDLGYCLDLMSRNGVQAVNAAYTCFVEIQEKSGLPLPSNRNPRGVAGEDQLFRFLDCAVFRCLHQLVKEHATAGPFSQLYDTSRVSDDYLQMNPAGPFSKPYDTVRGVFVEGPPAYSGSGLYSKSHIQIAVVNPSCIKGVFYHRAVGE